MVLLGIVVLSACSGDSGTTPSGSDLTGRWRGDVTLTGIITEPFEFSFVQTGSAVTGTWTAFHPAGGIDVQGNVSGTINSSTLASTMTLTGCPSGTSAAMSGTVSGASLRVSSAAGFVSSNSSCRTQGFQGTVTRQ